MTWCNKCGTGYYGPTCPGCSDWGESTRIPINCRTRIRNEKQEKERLENEELWKAISAITIVMIVMYVVLGSFIFLISRH